MPEKAGNDGGCSGGVRRMEGEGGAAGGQVASVPRLVEGGGGQ
jgi:hypothetical protein